MPQLIEQQAEMVSARGPVALILLGRSPGHGLCLKPLYFYVPEKHFIGMVL